MAEPRTRVEAVFTTTALVVDPGSRLVAIGKDWAETELVVTARRIQQPGFAHAAAVGRRGPHHRGCGRHQRSQGDGGWVRSSSR
jgi:hypothetical protein